MGTEEEWYHGLMNTILTRDAGGVFQTRLIGEIISTPRLWETSCMRSEAGNRAVRPTTLEIQSDKWMYMVFHKADG